MNLLQMEYFQELAKTENITKAAANLHVSQPAVSAMLRRLETELEMELFDRQGRSIKLNENGRSFYRSVRSILEIIERNRKKKMLQAEQPRQEITVGIICSEDPLLPHIVAYMKLHPEVDFRLNSNRAAVMQMGIHSLDFYLERYEKRTKGMASIDLPYSTEAPAYLLVPNSHGLSKVPYLTVQMLADYIRAHAADEDAASFVQVMPTGFSNPTEFLFLRKHGITPQVRIVTDDRFTLLNLVSNSGMVTVVPTADKNLAGSVENISAIPLYAEQPEAPELKQYRFAFLPERLTVQAKAFLDYVMDVFGLTEQDIHQANQAKDNQ